MYDLDFWKKNGYYPKIFISDELEVERFRSAYDDFERQNGVKSASLVNLHQGRDRFADFLYQLAMHPRIKEAVRFFLGKDFRLFGTHIFCKQGNETEKYVDWHQDATYWNVDNALTVWYALDDSTPESGCIQVIPATHLKMLEDKITGDTNNMLTRPRGLDIAQDQIERAVDLPLKAGEATIFHSWVIHSSKPNQSAYRRCGIGLRYAL